MRGEEDKIHHSLFIRGQYEQGLSVTLFTMAKDAPGEALISRLWRTAYKVKSERLASYLR